jgi:plastocyanin
MDRLVAVVLMSLALVVAVPASAGTTEIAIHDNYFSPDTRRVDVGGSVRWFRAADSNGFHNVREDGWLFESGDPTGDPIDYSVAFSAGTFHYFCETHGGPLGGMDGFIRVPVSIDRPPEGLPFTVRWATGVSATGSAFDVQFRVGSGRWRTWKTDATKNKGVFGKDGRPMRVRDGVRYSFRARSQDGPNVSRWSPVVSIRP